VEYKKIDNQYIVRIDKGEEIVETLQKFSQQQGIMLAKVSGIGATDNIEVGVFKCETKELITNKFCGVFEITCLVGNITHKDKDAYIHLHINFSDINFRVFGGHLIKAFISGTCEVMIDVGEGDVDREFSGDIGLNIFKF
jgi:predicted DNA-binding protein with PD1-like motif